MAARVVHVGCVALAVLAVLSHAAVAAEPGEGFRPIGSLRPRHAREIAGSNWSIGAETMDRDFTVYAHWKQHLGPLGAKKARIQSGWAKTEKEPGKYNWTWLDEIVNDMVDQGVEPWVCICYGNPIYKDGGETGLGGVWPRSEEALAAWDRYVAALVDRYKSHVDEWEIWNEPSLRSKDVAESATGYADFLMRTAGVVRSRQPKAKILGLSLPGIPMPFAERVLKCLKEKNGLSLIDEVTYHPYSTNPCASYSAVGKLRDLVRSYSPDLKLRQGENGAPSMKGGFGAIANYEWDEERQAKWALRRLLGDLGRDIPSSYFSICDMKYPDRMNYKGLLAVNDDKTVHHVKQAYRAVQHVTAVFDNSVKRIDNFKGRIADDPKPGRYSLFAYRNEKGGHIVTLWRSDANPGAKPEIEAVGLSLPGVRFTEPVWVEMLSGKVYAIDPLLWSQKDDEAEFRKLPVFDSPILIAEQAALPMAR